MNFLGHVVRFVIAAIVLMVVSWIVPGFAVGGFWSALLLALVIALLGWIVEGIFGKRVNPFGRGIVGFIVSALVIWLGQYVVDHVEVSLLGAILGLRWLSGLSISSSRYPPLLMPDEAPKANPSFSFFIP